MKPLGSMEISGVLHFLCHGHNATNFQHTSLTVRILTTNRMDIYKRQPYAGANNQA